MAILGSGGHLCAEKEGKIIEQLIESVQVNIFIVDSSQEYIRAASDVLKKISNNIKVKSVCKPFIGIGNLLADSKLVTKDTFLVTTCLGITTGNEAFQEKDVVFLENILSFSGRTLSKQALVLLDYDGNLDLLERKKAYDNPIMQEFMICQLHHFKQANLEGIEESHIKFYHEQKIDREICGIMTTKPVTIQMISPFDGVKYKRHVPVGTKFGILISVKRQAGAFQALLKQATANDISVELMEPMGKKIILQPILVSQKDSK